MAIKSTKKPAAKKLVERPVVVTTLHRGVFFGYATETRGETIELRRGRNIIYWSADVKGFIGLAANGPTTNCKVGPEADLQLRNITSVLEVSEAARAAWESNPWG
jgi:hypothetical protein